MVAQASRPSIQQAIYNELAADPQLRSEFEMMARSNGVSLRLAPLLPQILGSHAPERGESAQSAEASGEDDDGSNPFAMLFNGIASAAQKAGAAIGAYVQTVISRIQALSAILRGATRWDGIVSASFFQIK